MTIIEIEVMDVYAIRQKSTGFFLPKPKGRMGRGGSHTEPQKCLPKEIRRFHSKISAERALTAWLMGKHIKIIEWEQESWEMAGYYAHVGNEVIPQPHRKREDMEVIILETIAKPSPTV